LKYEPQNQKVHKYQFAVTANGRKDVSKLDKADVILCGKEKVVATQGT